MHWYTHGLATRVSRGDGYYFSRLHRLHQRRYWSLVKEHTHSVNAAVNGLSALPGVARPFAAVKAMSRFLNHPDIPLCALIEPAQDAVRLALQSSTAAVALVVHDWCMFAFQTHTSKTDRRQRSHDQDLGYDLGTALVLEAEQGQPLGPLEFRLRTATGILSTRPGTTAHPPAHLDELADVMQAARRWHLHRPLVHLIDREADSVGHYRAWQAAGHQFVVRADAERLVLWHGQPTKLPAIAAGLTGQYREARDAAGQPVLVTTRQGVGRLRVAEAAVVLHRPAKTMRDGRKVDVPGPPLALRLVVTRVVDELGVVRAEWLLFTNVADQFDAATVGQWYAWRWRIETYHKLLKTAGQNAEEWQQESGLAFARRLVVASLACLTAWQLQRDESPAAVRLRTILVRLSGRQMKHRVCSTAPALLAGLEKLLAVVDVLEGHDWEEILDLAHRLLPNLFNSA